MKNDIFCILSLVLYIIVVWLLVRKARDIFLNPQKYNKIKGWNQYRRSFWYEPLSVYHEKFFAKNYIAPIIIGIPFFLLSLAVYIFLSLWIQKYIFLPDGAMLLISEGICIGLLGAIFYSICLEYWLCFYSTIPILIACSMTAFNSNNRSGDWKKLVCGMLITSVLCIPVMVAGTNSYAYVNIREDSCKSLLEYHRRRDSVFRHFPCGNILQQ